MTLDQEANCHEVRIENGYQYLNNEDARKKVLQHIDNELDQPENETHKLHIVIEMASQ